MRRDGPGGRMPTKDLVPMSGRLLARLPRGIGPDGVEQEVRITLDDYQGSPFVRLALWARTVSGWMPLKGRFATVRRGELAETLEALQAATREIGAEPEPRTRPETPPKAGRSGRGRKAGAEAGGDWTRNLPPAVGSDGAAFDEL